MKSLEKFAQSLRELPRVIAVEVAKAAAPAITEKAASTFAAGEDAYGVSWVDKKDGEPATLVDTGALRSGLRYIAVGEKLRCQLGVSYAKYQIGRRPVFPRRGSALPKAYTDALSAVTSEVIKKELAP